MRTITPSVRRLVGSIVPFITIFGPAILAAIRVLECMEIFTFVNNVLFNYRHRTVDGGDHRSFFNIINNYYKPGPGHRVNR